MTYPTLYAAIGTDSSEDTLSTAMACARLWQSELDVMCVAARYAAADLVMPGVGAAILVEADQDAREALDLVEGKVRETLERETFSWTLSRSMGEVGLVSRTVAHSGRFADLAILARPKNNSAEAEAIFESMLFTSSVPILLHPSGKEPKFDTVVIAWDDSAQALATVRAALPLLAGAKTVRILMIDPDAPVDSAFTPGEDLARMLSRHGVHAEIRTEPKMQRRVSEIILQQAREIGAGVVVMGAYGHSKMREQFLGGVTRDMLERDDVALFLTH